MDRVVRRRIWAIALVVAIAATGCYAQQPLPRQPEYRPASWEPILGITNRDGEDIEFDEPATIEADYVVGRVDGASYAVPLSDVHRLLVGRKTLNKPKTVLAGILIGVVFVLFWRSIEFES